MPHLSHMRAVTLLFAAVGSAALDQERLPETAYTAPSQVEREPASTPASDPVAAWQANSALVQPGHWVRRIAFARHGMFILSGPASGAAVDLQFVGWNDGEYRVEFAEPGDVSLCKAPGVPVERIGPALDALMHDPQWQSHRAQMDTLILECFEPSLFWWLMPTPPEGFQAGVSPTTYRVPFQY